MRKKQQKNPKNMNTMLLLCKFNIVSAEVRSSVDTVYKCKPDKRTLALEAGVYGMDE